LNRMERLAIVVVLVGAVTALPAAVSAADETAPNEQEETRICPGCGETIPASSVFCPNCHRYLPDAKAKKAICPECGAEVVWPETICPKCGAYVKGNKPPIKIAEPEERPPAAYRPEWKTRFSGRLRAGAMITEGHTVPGGAVILGARISEEVAVGGGLGYQSYPNATSVPLFLSARAFFFPAVIEPSVFGEIGYNVAKLKESWPGADDASGFLVGVGLGLDIVFYRGFGWTLDAGGRMEMSKEYYRYINSIGEMSPVYSRSTQDIYFVVGSGMTF
jgi:predicted RNA-binding Zn-ribbon protein involved in translation (DUF1610 family)